MTRVKGCGKRKETCDYSGVATGPRNGELGNGFGRALGAFDPPRRPAKGIVTMHGASFRQPPQGAESSSHGREPVVGRATTSSSPRRGRHRDGNQLLPSMSPPAGAKRASTATVFHGLTAVATGFRPLRGLTEGRTVHHVTNG